LRSVEVEGGASANTEVGSVNDLPASPDITAGDDTPMTESDWVKFQDRVTDAANLSRAATANAVTALTSLSLAVAAAAIAISTADRRAGVWQNAALVAIAGAIFASLVLISALIVEAARATRVATTLHALYLKEYFTPNPKKKDIWPRLLESKISVNFHWKVSVPATVLAVGIIACFLTILLHFK
jgi:hypothetical protein